VANGPDTGGFIGSDPSVTSSSPAVFSPAVADVGSVSDIVWPSLQSEVGDGAHMAVSLL